MKLICVRPHKKKQLIYLKPDNCLIRNNEDFYLPEFSQEILIRPALVIKIKKIGKKINTRFAHRYYDDISAGFSFEAQDRLQELQERGLPWDPAVSFDRSASLGTFANKEECKELIYTRNKQEVGKISIQDLPIEESIAQASQLFTLKIGDLIYITNLEEGFQTHIGEEYSAYNDQQALLHCEIK